MNGSVATSEPELNFFREFEEHATVYPRALIYTRSESIRVTDWTGFAAQDEIVHTSMAALAYRLAAFRLIEAAPAEILPAVVSELRDVIQYQTDVMEELERKRTYVITETVALPIWSG